MSPALPTSTHAPSIAACQNVEKTYRTSTEHVFALRNVSLQVFPGRVTLVSGASGSGKSTLLRLLACVDTPDAGRVTINQHSVEALRPRARRRLRRREVAYLFQRPSDNLLPYLTALEQIHNSAALREYAVPQDEAIGLLTRLGLAHRSHHRPSEMSGGEQQRLAVACGVIGAPALVIADEPTAELDATAAAAVLGAIQDMASTGVTFVVSSHDPRLTNIAEDVVHLEHGRVMLP